MRYRRPIRRRTSGSKSVRFRRRRAAPTFLNPISDQDKIRIDDEAYVDKFLADAFKAVHGRSVPECLEYIPDDVYDRLVNAFQEAYEYMAAECDSAH